ncbi:hypothetical protein [Tumebacillus lipolyticus]|uniref:DUF1328 domain-containing protein n=1 Tax=Tumebacillus lipolyticus TaxID=1280370 RepID=A0ABW5A0K6_9BACL
MKAWLLMLALLILLATLTFGISSRKGGIWKTLMTLFGITDAATKGAGRR